MADAGTTHAGLVISAAIFGGAGAFLGAVLGQVIGWIREERSEARVDRRRAEDAASVVARERRERRYSEYLAIQSFLQDTLVRLRHLDMMSWAWSREGSHEKYPKLQESVEEALDKVVTLMTSDLASASARAHIVGSEKVRNAMRDFESSCAIFGSNLLTNTVSTLREGGLEEYEKRHRAGEPVDLEDYFVEKTITWTEVGQSIHETALRTAKLIPPIQQILREELELT